MIKHKDGSVTLTKQEIDWLNDNFQGGKHTVRIDYGRYTIIDNEGNACGWGGHNDDYGIHIQFMDDFTSLSD